MQTRLLGGSERRPSSAAVYSMRLLVVCGSPPDSSTCVAAGGDDDRRPAAGAGVAAARAVRPHERLALASLDRDLLRHRAAMVDGRQADPTERLRCRNLQRALAFVGPPNDALGAATRESSRGAGSQCEAEELSSNGQPGYRACARVRRRHAAGVPVQAPRRQRRAGRRAPAAAGQREGPVPFEVVRRRYGDRGRRLAAACRSADARAAVDGAGRAVDRSDRGRGPRRPAVRLHGATTPVGRRRHDGTRPDGARRHAPLAGRGARDVRRADADRLRSRHAGPGDHARRRSAPGGAVAPSRRCARSGGGRSFRRD